MLIDKNNVEKRREEIRMGDKNDNGVETIRCPSGLLLFIFP